ncbi:nucleoside triphosphate pyrophosphatase [Photobacterium sp. 1_MG-2023]|uniref:Maf family protein n=1 Tax=Photobacterium sp. 1_MG-2023 TaxID=3062646 RepID=UPI0026E298B0|nr:Maf family protein [Photobacterium sp. 1_MG-2023]MDO6706395.1 Maf family protein [Photobacterium sp. 1_MG-2023]
MTQVYLASGSPRRKELLTQLGYAFDILTLDVAEQHQPDETPADYVQRLSLDKAMAGVRVTNGTIPVVGSDTIVVVDGQILEKPRDFAHSREMLMLLSGRSHQVMTAVTVATEARQATTLVVTDVWFRALTEQDIQDYWQSGEPQDKAGSYAIQGIGGKFIVRIEGSYHAVVGLPLLETDALIREFITH